MAISFTDAFVEVDGNDLSEYVTSVTLSIEADDVDTTTMGNGGARTRIGGLKDGSVSITFVQDFGAAALDATLWPLFNTVVGIVIRPTSSAVGTSNPEYSFDALVNKYEPVSGSVGDRLDTEVEWPISGAVTRATS